MSYPILDLKYIPMVNEIQVKFGRKLGLDLSCCSVNVAQAAIDDDIDVGFYGVIDLGKATVKQVALAKKFGCDISFCSKRIACAVIDDIMCHLNMESIYEQGLVPGVVVRHKYSGWIKTISSVKDDGTVYMKGGNGVKAWGRSLEKIENDVASNE